MCAARAGRIDCVRLLIDEGADKEAKNKVRVRVGRFHHLFDHLVAILLVSFVIFGGLLLRRLQDRGVDCIYCFISICCCRR